MGKKVLVVDDSLMMREVIRKTVETAGFEVIGEAATGEEAVHLALRLLPDYITLDVILPDVIGTEILPVLLEEGSGAKIILVSAVGQESVVREGLRLGAKSYLVKPFTSSQLLNALSKPEN